MSEYIHRVGIVVDRSIEKDKLKALSKRMHVWLLESESNLASARDILETEQFNEGDLLADGVTTFSSPDTDLPPALILEGILDEIDEHHNEYSHTPGWSEVHVSGVKLDAGIEKLFKEFGFSRFKILDHQVFIAKR